MKKSTKNVAGEGEQANERRPNMKLTANALKHKNSKMLAEIKIIEMMLIKLGKMW